MKKKKLLLLIPLIAAVAAGGFFYVKSTSAPVQAGVPVEMMNLTLGDLRSTISTTGIVESTDTERVYSKLTYNVQEIKVKVGDMVKKGDILCTLNSDTLKDNIEKGKLELWAKQQSAKQSVKTSEKEYADAKAALDKGLNASLNQAQQAVTTAKTQLDDAKKKLETAKSHVSGNMNSNLLSAQSAVSSAQSGVTSAQNSVATAQNSLTSSETALGRAESALRDRKNELGSEYNSLLKDYDKAESEYNAAVRRKADDEEEKKQALLAAKDALTQAENDADELYVSNGSGTSILKLRQNVTDAQSEKDRVQLGFNNAQQGLVDAQQKLTEAQKNLEVAQKATGEDIGGLEDAVAAAQTGYDNAVKSQKVTKEQVDKELERAKLGVETSKVNADDTVAKEDLKTLQEQIEECAVLAPTSGTITGVYATQNAPASGLLFLIENTGSLQLTVKVKEFDVNTVQPGMSAVITADATGEDEYEGELNDVAPAAKKNVNPETGEVSASAGTTNVEFDATVGVTSEDTRLRIGMNAKADIITEKKEGVFSVPYEAVGTNAEGKNIIYIAEKQKDGTFLPKEIPVTLGMETDLVVEISGDGLTDGMEIIADAKNIVPGMAVSPTQAGGAGGAAIPVGGSTGAAVMVG